MRSLCPALLLRARLDGMYGGAASLVLEKAESGGACARIRLPYRPSSGGRADAP